MDFTPTNLPIENQYPKLVRDRIPEIVEAKGKKANIKTLQTDDEYLRYLLKKVTEKEWRIR